MLFARSLAAALLAAAALAASAAALDLSNAIGVYAPEPRSTDDLRESTNYTGDPGTFQAYAVLLDPWNDNTGAPIANLGGFEFRLALPGNVMLMGANLPPSCTNFRSPPDFVVGCNIPVSGGMVTLARFELAEFAGTRSSIYLAPVSDFQSIPGRIAIADADDDFSITEAVPASGSFDRPVFDLYWEPVVQNATWSDVKSLYR